MDVSDRKVVVLGYEPNLYLYPLVRAGIDCHLAGYEAEWHWSEAGEVFGAALRDVAERQTRPFLLLLDDYVLIDHDDDLLHVAWEIGTAFGCVRLVPCPGPTEQQNDGQALGKVNPADRYSVSLQASIWQPDALLSVVDAGDSPWDVEIKGMARYADNPTYTTVSTYANAVSYANLLRGGKLVQSEHEKVRKMYGKGEQ